MRHRRIIATAGWKFASALIAVSLLASACDRRAETTPGEAPANATTKKVTTGAPDASNATDESADPGDRPTPAPSPTAFAYQPFVIPLNGEIVVPNRRDAAAMPAGLVAPGDVNRDEKTDLVVLIDASDVAGAATRRIVAMSGADHSILWSIDSPLRGKPDDKKDEPAPEIIAAGLRPLPDINDDTIPDVFVMGDGEHPGFAALSGKDGALIGINAQPKNALIQLVDIREATGDTYLDFIFATALENKSDAGEPERLGFAIYSSGNFRRAVSFKRPFGRMAKRQTLLFGPFPDSNQDDVPEILCYGVVPANRLNQEDEAQFALVDGKRLSRWVLTRTTADPTHGPSFIASPGIVIKDSFADIIISTPADASRGEPSGIGLYVMKRFGFEWQVRGNEAGGPAAGEANAETKASLSGYGAPLVVVPDVNGDGISDIATTITIGAGDSRELLLLSSANGQVLDRPEGPADTAIEPRHDRVQCVAYADGGEPSSTMIALTGRTTRDGRDHPAIILYAYLSEAESTAEEAPAGAE